MGQVGAWGETMRRRVRKGGGRQVELTIEKIGGRGDGYVSVEGRPLFVPFTVPGDRVRVRITSQTASGTRGEVVELLAPGPERREPPCPHFGVCGGCSLQMLDERGYVAWKEELVSKALSQAGLTPEERAAMVRMPPHSRRRAIFGAHHGNQGLTLGFRGRMSHRIVPIASCLLLRPALDALLGPLAALLQELGLREGGIIATECSNGVDLALSGLDDSKLQVRERLVAFAEDRDLARLSLFEDERNSEPVIIRRRPVVEFGDVGVAVPPGVFLQASKAGEEALVAAMTRELSDNNGSIAELFSGAGSFTFRLAHFGKVDAFEIDGAALAALEVAVREHGLAGRIAVHRRDLYRQPLRAAELAEYSSVVFDPPRAGAREQAALIAESGVPLVIAVSCNPATFSRDVKVLVDCGYRLTRLTAVDQFVWSSHVELVGVLRRSSGCGGARDG